MRKTQTRKDALSDDLSALHRLFEDWRRAWLGVDAKLMLSLFDDSFDDIAYLAEENDDAARGIAGVTDYWANTSANVLAKVPCWEPVEPPLITVVGVDAALIWARLNTHLVLHPPYPRDLVGVLRCSLGARRRPSDGAWRIVHYHESRHLFPKTDDLSSSHPFTADIFIPNAESADAN